jgi:hypothetical protein
MPRQSFWLKIEAQPFKRLYVTSMYELYVRHILTSYTYTQACLMIIFCTAFVALRYYSRYLTSTALNTEDVLIPFAWLAEMGLCIVSTGTQCLKTPFTLTDT